MILEIYQRNINDYCNIFFLADKICFPFISVNLFCELKQIQESLTRLLDYTYRNAMVKMIEK